MVVRCIRCKARLDVPDERSGNPSLKLKCPGCGLVFPLAKAPRVARVGSPGEAGAGGNGPEAAAAGPMAGAAPVGIHQAPAGQAQPAPAAGPGGAAPWTGCANHPQVRSIAVCIRCNKGWCQACGQRVANAVICPGCEGLTVLPSLVEEAREREKRRQTPLLEQLPDIANYPFRNLFVFGIMYAVIVGLTIGSFTPLFGLWLFLARESLLVALSLMTIVQVSNAKFTFEFMNVESRSDLYGQLVLGLTVLVVLQGPRIVWAFVMEPSSFAVAVGWLLLGWSIFYAPMAFISAAVSRSFLQTVKFWLGFGAMQRMGAVYWQAAGLFIAAKVGLVVAAGLAFAAPTLFEVMGRGKISWAGLVVRVLFLIWVEVYLAFALGALLGHAVDKRARELELE